MLSPACSPMRSDLAPLNGDKPKAGDKKNSLNRFCNDHNILPIVSRTRAFVFGAEHIGCTGSKTTNLIQFDDHLVNEGTNVQVSMITARACLCGPHVHHSLWLLALAHGQFRTTK